MKKLGCGKSFKDELESDIDGEYYNICGKTEIIEMNGNRYYWLCEKCSQKIKPITQKGRSE